MPVERYIPLQIGASAEWKESLDFVALRDDEEGFRIIVINRSLFRTFIIKFEKPLAYRNCDEGKRLKSLSELKLHAPSLYRVEHSEFAAWLNDQSGYTADMEPVTYAVVTENDWVEVISRSQPTVVEA